MPDSPSIRAYSPSICSHKHEFNQVVLPLHGVIEITVDGSNGAVGSGQAVIVPKGVEHSFNAKEQARFLVADLKDLPARASGLPSPFVTVSKVIQSFSIFAETLLQHQSDPELEGSLISLLKKLLDSQDFTPRISSRISRVIEFMDAHLHNPDVLEELPQIANLSPSHFKVDFKRQMGKTCRDFLIERRMERARALLAHTDMPIQLVAENVGYTSLSAFSRRFTLSFGEPPSQYKAR